MLLSLGKHFYICVELKIQSVLEIRKFQKKEL